MSKDQAASGLRIVPSTIDDRRRIYDVLLHSGVFGRSDADTVDEMFVEAFVKPSAENYQFLSCWDGTELVGFACYGHESLTHGTWDLFWICVSGVKQRKGAGRALMSEVQHRAVQERVRLMVIYTSSTAKYAAARGLYESQGFLRTAVVPDYYADGDDLYVYTKRITGKE